MQVDGTDELKQNIARLIQRYDNVFRRTVGTTPAKVAPLILDVDESKWKVNKNRTSLRIQSVLKEEFIKTFIQQALRDGVLLTPKPDGTFRFCVDFRSLNDASVSNG